MSIFDWGFLHSDATYDAAHVWKGSIFRLDDHIDRFLRNVDKLRMKIPFGKDGLRSLMVDCVAKTGIRDGIVEMICTRGVPEPGSRDPRTCKNNFFAFVVPMIWVASPEKQKEGLHVIVSEKHRISTSSVDPTIKNFHWLDMTMGLFEAYDRGGESAILRDSEGHLVEGPGFNIFAVEGTKIVTPRQGSLDGITRRTAIELGRDSGHDVVEGELSVDAAYKADEIFITSTAGGIIPVTTIDHQKVGSGKPGPVTTALAEKYWALHEDPRYGVPVKY